VETCVFLSRELAEPLAGTAPTTPGWLLLEHPGPWAAKAVGDSRGLDDGVGHDLAKRSAAAGFRATLIRRPGTSTAGATRVAYLAWTEPGATWMRRFTVSGPADLLALDLSALAGPPAPTLGEAVTDPLMLVCTNGRRDRCCATEGRPIAAALAAARPDATWEATHLGGHRFAPTAVVLPHGYLYGRLDPDSAREVLTAAERGDVLPELCRGRATYSRAAQTAELAVRVHTGITAAEALRVHDERAEDAGAWTVRVDHRDGRTWTVAVAAHREAPARPESCGKDEGLPTSLRARVVSGPGPAQ